MNAEERSEGGTVAARTGFRLMAILHISFQGRAGDDRDNWVRQTVHRHNGAVIAEGKFPRSSDRDLQAELPDDRWRACKRELEGRGYRVELEG